VAPKALKEFPQITSMSASGFTSYTFLNDKFFKRFGSQIFYKLLLSFCAREYKVNL